MTHPLIIDHLTKDYGSLRAVDNVCFEVQEGEIFGLLGPNGAGKTSIISVINTLIAPTVGTARVFGVDVTQKPKLAKIQIGCVPQELISHGFFNLEEILHIHSGYYGLKENRAQIELLIDRLGLTSHRKKRVNALSGGLKRRLLIAKALLHKPKLVLLDEPTAGVDVELRRTLWDFVFELQSQGTSFLLTTHYLEEAEKMCDRVGIIDHGQLKMIGKTAELIEEYTARDVVISLKESVDPITHPNLSKQSPSALVFKLPGKQTVGDLLTSLSIDLLKIQDIKIREGTLEDLFARITRKNA